MPVKREKTVEERREDGLKGEEILDTNQGYETGSLTDGMTAETFSKSLILGEETKRGQYKVRDLDKEVVEEKSEDGQNLIPNSKREARDESVMVKTMLSDNTKNWKIVKTVKSHNPGTQKGAMYNETDVKFQMEKWRQGMVEEERESRLVAGMNLHETRGDTPEDEKIVTVKQEVAEKGGNRERAENSQQILTHAQNPPSTPPPPPHHHHNHNVPPPFPVTPTQVPPASSLPSTVYAKFTSQFFPPAVTIPNPSVSTAVPGEVRSVSLLEDLLIEFLVMSNNRLTDGTIEGAFEGVPALKRLYLDRNLLKSVPTDLPVSLEELRLDNNQLGVMSEAAWARCPGLLVLSLSNNSLGNGSESLPNAVLSPLCNLRTLNLDHNQLTSVPQGLPLSIKELYLKGNLIGQFRGGAFNGVSELLVLDLSANRLTNKGLLRESLLNATHLESLNLEGNRLKQVPRHLPRSLKTLNLEGNLILSIKKAAFSTLKNLEHLGLARNKIFKVAIGAFRTLPVLHQLDLCHNTLRQVPRQLPQGLHSVALSNNKIQSVPRDAFCWGDKSLTLSRLIRVQLEHNLIDMGKLDAQAFRCLRGFQSFALKDIL
uniref:Wu:fc23c09 n=1 Tax=Seriola dumerili TaxID=41447 RepID=A0A3B4T9B2_SERDU